MSGVRWIAETLHESDGHCFALTAERMIVESKTAHQDLAVFDNPAFGRVMMLDGALQLTTADEFIYHEMMVHVPLFAHGSARRVLIVGGGDGGIAREVLKHRSVEAVTLVEIDADVLDFARTHFPGVGGGAFEDRRLSVVIGDGLAYAAQTADRFDVAIIDSTDPDGPAEGLFTAAFVGDCHRLLAPGGVLVTQAGAPFLQRGGLIASIANLAGSFRDAGCYLSAVPTYTGGHFAHGWGCDRPELRAVPVGELERRFAAAGLATRYYTPSYHAASFVLPRFIGQAVEEGRRAAMARDAD